MNGRLWIRDRRGQLESQRSLFEARTTAQSTTPRGTRHRWYPTPDSVLLEHRGERCTSSFQAGHIYSHMRAIVTQAGRSYATSPESKYSVTRE